MGVTFSTTATQFAPTPIQANITDRLTGVGPPPAPLAEDGCRNKCSFFSFWCHIINHCWLSLTRVLGLILLLLVIGTN